MHGSVVRELSAVLMFSPLLFSPALRLCLVSPPLPPAGTSPTPPPSSACPLTSATGAPGNTTGRRPAWENSLHTASRGVLQVFVFI